MVTRWTATETKRALYLYFQLPFGQIHSRNPKIIALAAQVGRSSSSIAMKLANFASLDPKITNSGRKGLVGATVLDRQVWTEFHQDWTRLIVEVGARIEPENDASTSTRTVKEDRSSFDFKQYNGPSAYFATVQQRIGQNFFRRAVLANYDVACCITGISEPRLLNASHIVPWGLDEFNRHNPENGLCFSATFDRAFDRGLITVLPSLMVKVARCLNEEGDAETRAFFERYVGIRVRSGTRFEPKKEFLEWHNAHCFVDD